MADNYSQRPQDSDFYQQRLKAWQPILTPFYVVLTFLVIGGGFVGLGFFLKSVSDGVVEYRAQYDGEGTPASAMSCMMGPVYNASNPSIPSQCTVTIPVEADMKGPVYVYYELDNFYQNHRRYVKSVSSSQLAGTVYSSPDDSGVSDCDPLKGVMVNGTMKLLDPCGLIASSFFNDSISLGTALVNGQAVNFTMDESNISWASDRDKKFKALSNADIAAKGSTNVFIDQMFPGTGLMPNATNEHFIVWMRPAALPTFRKLYGRIEADVKKGTQLSFDIDLRYPVLGFKGKKAIVISTVSFLGGKNPFMGIAYIAVGFICIALALLFAVKQVCGGRRPADTGFLLWQGK